MPAQPRALRCSARHWEPTWAEARSGRLRPECLDRVGANLLAFLMTGAGIEPAACGLKRICPACTHSCSSCILSTACSNERTSRAKYYKPSRAVTSTSPTVCHMVSLHSRRARLSGWGRPRRTASPCSTPTISPGTPWTPSSPTALRRRSSSDSAKCGGWPSSPGSNPSLSEAERRRRIPLRSAPTGKVSRP